MHIFIEIFIVLFFHPHSFIYANPIETEACQKTQRDGHGPASRMVSMSRHVFVFFFFVSVVFILISNGPGMAQYVTSTGLKLYYCSWKNSAYKIAFEVFDKFENNVTLCQLHHYTATTARQFTIDFLKNCPFPTMINPYIYVFIYFS